jgi:hypothetical protein
MFENRLPRKIRIRMKRWHVTGEWGTLAVERFTICTPQQILLLFIAVLSIALLLWKLWAFGFLFDISETFPCLVCLLLAKIVLLLDALEQLTLFVQT